MERKLVIDGFSILKYLPFYDKSSPSIALLDRMTRDREKSHAAALWHQNGNNVEIRTYSKKIRCWEFNALCDISLCKSSAHLRFFQSLRY